MECLFYKIYAVWRGGRTGLVLILHALEIGVTHLDTHPHLSVAGSATQTAENIVRQLVKLIALFQTQIARALEGYLNVLDNRSRMRTHDKDPVRQVNRLLNVM